MNDKLFEELKQVAEELNEENKNKKECEKNLKNPEFLWTIPGEKDEKHSDN